LKPLRIAISLATPDGGQPHPEVRDATLAAADLCTELGHEVREIASPVTADFTDTFIGLWAAGTVPLVAQARAWFGDDAELSDLLERWTLGLFDIGTQRGPEAAAARALEVFALHGRSFDSLFESVDVILTPVLRSPPYPIGFHDPQGDFETIFSRVVDEVAYTPIHNALGTPAMSVPLHWTADQLPVGVQFAAARGQEALLLQLAFQLEEARPWGNRRPPVHAG
jgi:amidase